MAVLGLCFCARAFSSCGERGPLFIAVRRPLTTAASLVAEHRFQTRRLSSCGSRAQLLRGMRDLPRPGLEPLSPALAGRLSTTAPPGKPVSTVFNSEILMEWKFYLILRLASWKEYITSSQMLSRFCDRFLIWMRVSSTSFCPLRCNLDGMSSGKLFWIP